jgi:hypothetical protein
MEIHREVQPYQICLWFCTLIIFWIAHRWRRLIWLISYRQRLFICVLSDVFIIHVPRLLCWFLFFNV